MELKHQTVNQFGISVFLIGTHPGEVVLTCVVAHCEAARGVRFNWWEEHIKRQRWIASEYNMNVFGVAVMRTDQYLPYCFSQAHTLHPAPHRLQIHCLGSSKGRFYRCLYPKRSLGKSRRQALEGICWPNRSNPHRPLSAYTETLFCPTRRGAKFQWNALSTIYSKFFIINKCQ